MKVSQAVAANCDTGGSVVSPVISSTRLTRAAEELKSGGRHGLSSTGALHSEDDETGGISHKEAKKNSQHSRLRSKVPCGSSSRVPGDSL